MTAVEANDAKSVRNRNLAPVNPVEMIARLRNKHASKENNCKDGIYTDEELHSFVSMYVNQEIPDYQMSAWLMAVCFCPLTPRETATLTRCYAESGTLLEWPDKIIGTETSRPPLVDKHSSGGVGDKISLILAPLVATCGVCVPMIAGRGLGHTGGTIDKLETSFPGYTPEPPVQKFREIVLGANDDEEKAVDVGCAIVAAGPELCPADRRIYALRDVTATVSCLPLQVASIMSKKIAERPDSLVLDVKYGDGAFQDTLEGAKQLAESMVAVGEANGLTPTTAYLTDMNHPIGRAVGNWVEVEECIDVMKGNLKDRSRLRLSQDLIRLVVIQTGQMLHQSRKYGRNDSTVEETASKEKRSLYKQYESMSLEDCIRHAYEVLDSGQVLDKFHQMLLAQGAEPVHLKRALETPEAIPLAKYKAVWKHEEDSTIESINSEEIETCILDIPARTIGDVAVMVGAGRMIASDPVDGQAGLVFNKQTGDSVQNGDLIVTIYTNRSQEIANAALERVRVAVVFGKKARSRTQPRPSIVTHRVTKKRGTEAFVMPAFLVDGK